MASYCAQESNDVTQTDAAMSSSGDADEYQMRHADRGYAVIINNKTFTTGMNREGTDEDARDMKTLLLTLGFQEKNITTLQNATKLEMMNIMEAAATRDYTDCDCFVCVILTHGKEDVVLSSDNKEVRINQLAAQMRRTKCPSLAQKPKIFIIQACSGEGFDLGVTLTTQDPHHGENQSDVGLDRMPPEEPEKKEPDFLFAHSSVPGYYAWRNPRTGSLFIQSLVNVISNNWTQQDLLSMLTEVNSRVAYDNEFEMHSLKQMPFFLTLLTKKLFFHAH